LLGFFVNFWFLFDELFLGDAKYCRSSLKFVSKDVWELLDGDADGEYVENFEGKITKFDELCLVGLETVTVGLWPI
jgi:hypothetical protein